MNTLWIVWIIIALVTATLEILSPSFGLIFVSGAALIGSGAALVGCSWFVQIIVFGLVLLLSLFYLRPRFYKKIHSSEMPLSRTERLVGQRGYVTEPIDPVRGTGRVFVHGEDWAAKSLGELPEGEEVIIDGAEGIVLTVSPAT